MATNESNIAEDADVAECDGEKVVTMMDVLQEQQEFEEDANAVLGASDDKNCTYSKGYIKRQALYACLTCCTDAKDDSTKRAAVCLACSLTCHENHELVELYTKRNFRCDCGNPKFNGHPCQFTPDKTDLNEDNKYNQNFSGLYCVCNRPYPDPESSIEDEMIQCVICEDWLHATHLEATVPSIDQYSEMICKACMENNEFLHDYSQHAVNALENDDTEITVDKDITEMNGHESSASSIKDLEENKKTNGTETEMEVPENKDEATKDNNDIGKTDNDTNVQNMNPIKLDNVSNLPKDIESLEVTKDAESETTSDPTIVTNDDKDINTSEQSEVKEIQEHSMDTGIVNEGVKNSSEENSSNEAKANSEQVTLDNNSSENIQEINSAENMKMDCNDLQNKISPDVDQKVDNEEKSEIAKDNCGNIDGKEEEIGETSEDSKIDDESKAVDEENKDTNGLPTIKDKPNEVDPSDTNSSSDIEVKDVDKDSDKNNDTETNIKDNKRKLSTEELDIDNVAKKPKFDDKQCHRPRGVKKTLKGATFWPSNFRQKLCTCNNCLTMYKDLSILFLTDLEDTVIAYEALGKEKIDGTAASQYEKGLEALSSLGHVQQINALTEYNKMRDKLLEFLKSFKDRKEIVKEEDIKAFFARMTPKREPDGVYFCR